MGILVTFVCDYPECTTFSEHVVASEIDRYEYHDAPRDGFTANTPINWFQDSLYDWIACPTHRTEMLADRSKYSMSDH